MKARSILSGLMFLPLFCAIAVPARAQTGSSQQTLSQYVADLQNNPNDTALRAKIIGFVQTMRPAPAIPEEARGHYVMAATFMEKAKDNTGFERAVLEYKAALLAAPWWADAYKKLAIAQKAAEKYDDAVASLNFYLLTQPADARDAQDEIYKLKALKESAADDRKLAERKAAEEQQRRRREEEENSPQGKFEALLRKIDGRRYTCEIRTIDRSDNDAIKTVTSVIDIKGRSFVLGYIGVVRHPDYLAAGTIDIQGRDTALSSSGFTKHYIIAEDGSSITERPTYFQGQEVVTVYLWQR
ncbi:MAG: hypothetical protein ABSD13_02760 [Candidatus Korobacteraceae bacterium]|jgi:hypothetical protein